jgi:hypothetical protein
MKSKEMGKLDRNHYLKFLKKNNLVESKANYSHWYRFTFEMRIKRILDSEMYESYGDFVKKYNLEREQKSYDLWASYDDLNDFPFWVKGETLEQYLLQDDIDINFLSKSGAITKEQLHKMYKENDITLFYLIEGFKSLRDRYPGIDDLGLTL